MLVLTRKKEQSVQIGRHVTVTILRVKGGAVRIGIQAPPDVKILRSELPALPVSDEQGDAADGSGGVGRPAPNGGPETAGETSVPADRPPASTDPRRPVLKRGPAAPGFASPHAISAARCGAATLPAMAR